MRIELSLWTVIGATIEVILLLVVVICVRMIVLMRRSVSELREFQRNAERLQKFDDYGARMRRGSE